MLIYKIKKFHPADAYRSIEQDMVGMEVIQTGEKEAPAYPFYRRGHFREVRPDGTLSDFILYFRGVQLISTERIYNHGKV